MSGEICVWLVVVFFFFKQKTAYEMRISDWSSDVCSSDLPSLESCYMIEDCSEDIPYPHKEETPQKNHDGVKNKIEAAERIRIRRTGHRSHSDRSEEPPSELQSLMRISYAVFCLNNNKLTTLTS